MGQSGASCETKPAWTAGALSFVAIMAMTACAPVPRQLAANCAADEAALMALDYPAFDQSLPSGGWREVAERPGCRPAAAALIAKWRMRNGATVSPTDLRTLWWHEGQVLASAGDYKAAAIRLETARRLRNDPMPPPDAPATSIEGQRAGIATRDAWEDATIAFVRRDRRAFDRAYARLIAVPEPASFRETQALVLAKTGMRMAWPLNIDGVEQMRACFDHPYGFECRKR